MDGSAQPFGRRAVMNPRSTYLHDISALKSALISQLPPVVQSLFPARVIHRTAHEYRIGTQGSLSIRLADGSYFNHETGEGGDVFALIQHTLRTDFKGVLVWARSFTGQQHSTIFAPNAPARARLVPQPDPRAVRQRDKALAMLKRATDIKSTLAEAYLREKRGITMMLLPTSLRFLAHAYMQAARDLSARLVSESKKVRIATPPEGAKDFNDALRQGGRHAE